jgi:hypothetical protein
MSKKKTIIDARTTDLFELQATIIDALLEAHYVIADLATLDALGLISYADLRRVHELDALETKLTNAITDAGVTETLRHTVREIIDARRASNAAKYDLETLGHLD